MSRPFALCLASVAFLLAACAPANDELRARLDHRAQYDLKCQSPTLKPLKTTNGWITSYEVAGCGQRVTYELKEGTGSWIKASSPPVEENAVTDAPIKEQVQAWAKAIAAKDIDGVMSIYSPELVSFDLDPPLRYAGTENKRRAWEKFFSIYSDKLSYDVTELSVTAGTDTAFVHSLNHVTGQLANGQPSDMWVRWTACLHRANNAWLIVHDHASVPVDVAQGRAVLDLKP